MKGRTLIAVASPFFSMLSASGQTADELIKLMQETIQQIPAEEEVAGPAAAWRGVSRIEGRAEIEYRTWVEEGGETPSTVSSTTEQVSVRFELIRDTDLGGSALRWRAISARVEGSEQSTIVFQSGDTRGTTTVNASFRGAPERMVDFSLTVNAESGEWDLVTPQFLAEPFTAQISSQLERYQTGRGWYDDSSSWTEQRTSVQTQHFEGVVPTKPASVQARYQDEGLVGGRATRGYRTTARLTFHPVLDDFELEVAIADYAKWRPLGSVHDPAQAGNAVEARATLVPKGGAPTNAMPRVKAYRFALLDTSREPGVCLNWPLGATDRDPDLRLVPSPLLAGTASNEDQRLEVTSSLLDEQRRPYAVARIESFDFGGRATLQITCELEDGREIVGKMKGAAGEPGEDLVRLPRMAGPGWIAASWKEAVGTTGTADSDDSDRVEGQRYHGDGYTLYEEYRGWVVDGKRVEGDPNRKDFFVLNLIGGDAEPGIDLFEDLSQLRVHSKLRRSEMSETARLMNGNHRDAPQRVKQHGVWLKTFDLNSLGDSGALTVMFKAGVAGRPGLVKGIGILARGDGASEFNKPYNLPARDAIFAYDRAIAHELLHAVGVDHHGDGDERLRVAWVSPRHPRNPVGRPYFRSTGAGRDFQDIYTLLDEQGHDLAVKNMERYAEVRSSQERLHKDRMMQEARDYFAAREGVPGLPYKDERDFVEFWLEEEVSKAFTIYGANVGVPSGQHSGEEACVMRYAFAEYYPKVSGDFNTYYRVTPGTERIGFMLCRSNTGTGVNAPNPPGLPQSRYFSATRGNCFGQICPNDAIPPGK